MARNLSWILLLLALAGCSGMPASSAGSSACNPGVYQCQVDMYMKAGA